MEPDSLLVRGLVDNASRGLSPALDRSTTFERVPGRRLALRPRPRARRRRGRGAAERPRGRRGDGLRERHDGLDVHLPRRARTGQGARHPDERLLRGRAAGLRGARALRRRRAPLRPARPRGLPPRLRGRDARDHRDALQPVARGHRHRRVRGGRPRGRCAAVLRQHVRHAAPAAPARPRRRSRVAERDQVPRRALGPARRRLSRRATPPCTSASCGCGARSAACWRPIPPGCSCAASARCTCACPARSRRRPSWHGASRRTPTSSAVHYPGLPDHPGARARSPPDAGRSRRRAGLRARRRRDRRAAARRPCAWCATRPASAASRR